MANKNNDGATNFLNMLNDMMAAANELEKLSEELKGSEEKAKTSAYETLAKDTKEMYDAFVDAGFKEDQAFMLTETLLRNFTAK